MHRETLAPDAKVRNLEDKRRSVERTEMLLAFPQRPTDGSPLIRPRNNLFSFLPVRSVGFRFVLQAKGSTERALQRRDRPH